MNIKTLAVAFGAMVALSGSAFAKVSQSEADRLGKDLTPVGAIKAGNADGSIPAWTGGITAPPAGYTPGMHHISPYSADPLKFTITGASADQYKGKIPDGQLAMLKTYPAYKLNVYQTRRSCSLPERVYEANKRNAVSAAMTEDENGLNGAIVGNPFPIPQSGVEVVWNHRLRYRGFKIRRYFNTAAVNRDGSFTSIKTQDEAILHYSGPGINAIGDVTDVSQLNNIAISYLNITTSPARLAGSVILVHDTINAKEMPRQAWQYNPGTRRVLRAPELSYDNPLFNSDGLATTDQFDMFNGATDRFTWELKPQREMYIGYNAYELMSDKHSYKDVLPANFVNPDYGRYELHRVWVVEAKVKEGIRHVYGRRTMYFDEDSWNLVASDLYDTRGSLWRFQEGPIVNYYDIPLCSSAIEVNYDLQSGRYIAFSLKNEENMLNWNVQDLDAGHFTPDAMRRLGQN